MGMVPFPVGWNKGLRISHIHELYPYSYSEVVVPESESTYEYPRKNITFKEAFKDPDIREKWNRDTNNLSLSHLAHVYDPEVPGISNYLYGISWRPGSNLVYSFTLEDADGNKVGEIERYLYFETEKNPFRAYNERFFLNRNIQELGIADRIYKKQEDELFRPLASHPKSSIGIFANGDVGRYAWATKGFDFANKGERDNMLNELINFLGSSYALYNKTGKTPDDLQHSWDFAMLDDGQQHKLLNGKTGHFGKKFMIDHGPSWHGIKLLHPDSIHNKVSEIWEQAKQKKKVMLNGA